MITLQVKYILRTDIIKDEGNRSYTVYGITATDMFGNALKTVKNIFLNIKQAEEFIELCNSEKLELVHLQDVVEDVL